MPKPFTSTLRVGALTLQLDLDNLGQLRGVTLPATVPEGLDCSMLAEALKELEKFPLLLEGTEFATKVWERMLEIPWGSAMTYGEVAREVGSPGASRAVGTACAKNRLPLIVPCHRVLAEEGLGGFAFGLEWKAKLLELETEPLP